MIFIHSVSQTIPVMLKRDGKGLGFSIAGGKGATPYRGTDEVCGMMKKILYLVFVFSVCWK